MNASSLQAGDQPTARGYEKDKTKSEGRMNNVGPGKAPRSAAGHNEVLSPVLLASWDTQPLSLSTGSSIKTR